MFKNKEGLDLILERDFIVDEDNNLNKTIERWKFRKYNYTNDKIEDSHDFPFNTEVMKMMYSYIYQAYLEQNKTIVFSNEYKGTVTRFEIPETLYEEALTLIYTFISDEPYIINYKQFKRLKDEGKYKVLYINDEDFLDRLESENKFYKNKKIFVMFDYMKFNLEGFEEKEYLENLMKLIELTQDTKLGDRLYITDVILDVSIIKDSLNYQKGKKTKKNVGDEGDKE